MTYPYTKANFSGVTPASFGTPKYVGGYSLTAVTNGTYNSIDVSGVNNTAGVVYWQIDEGGAATSFTVETTIVLDSDTNGHQWLGLGVALDMTTAGTTPSTTLAWVFFRDGIPEMKFMTAGVNISSATSGIIKNLGLSGWVVGSSHVLKVDVVIDVRGCQEVKWYFDGVMVGIVTGIKTPLALKPIIMSYGNVARVMSMSGVSPSISTALAGQINVPEKNKVMKIKALNGIESSPFAIANRKTISGLVDIEGTYVSRKVRLYNKATGQLTDQQWSASNGAYRFDDLNPTQEYFVIAHDHERIFNSPAQDFIQP